jgi:transcriptional regulator of acetoin/glycerol metabolism
MPAIRFQEPPPALPTLDDVQRDHVLRVLEACHGIRTLAARVLEIDRKTLYRMLKRYEMRLSAQPECGSAPPL